jgi:PAS domain S-box-containing protein
MTQSGDITSMEWQWTPYTVPFVASAAISLVVLIPTFLNRDRRAAFPLMGVLVGGLMWSIAPGIRFSSTTEGAKLFWNSVRFLGPTIAVPSIFLFAAEFTNRREWLTRRRVALLLTPELITNIIVWTNAYHHLVVAETQLVTSGQFVTIDLTFGPYFWVQTIYHYAVLVVTTYWLVDEYRRVRKSGTKTYRTQAGLILFAMLIPWAANISFVTGLSEIDITPFGFVATGCLFAAGLFRYRLLDILPIARGTVIESMDNGVIVFDTENTIVDVNPRAREVIGLAEHDLIGLSFEEVFTEYPPVIETFAEARDARDQVSIRRNGSEYHYEVKVSPITDSLGNYVGRTIVFDDITVQVERQRELAQRQRELTAREEELDLMRQVQSRILRHNIPNGLQVVKTTNELMATELDEEYAEMAEMAVGKTDELITTSAKARTVEHLIDQEQTPIEFDLTATLTETIETYRDRFPSVTFSLDCPDTTRVTSIPALTLVFENLIENAADHNDAATPTVEVSVTKSPDQTIVTVRDNGPGIPDQELSVLDQGEETPLEHGSGMGLWAINWIIDHAEASIDFETGNGTTITIRIPG